MRSFILSESRETLVPFFGAGVRVTAAERGAWQYEHPDFIPCLHSSMRSHFSLLPAYPTSVWGCGAITSASARLSGPHLNAPEGAVSLGPQSRVPGKHVEVAIVVKHCRVLSNGYRGNETVDELSHRGAPTATHAIELRG